MFVCENNIETKYLSPTKNKTQLLVPITIFLFPIYFLGFK